VATSPNTPSELPQLYTIDTSRHLSDNGYSQARINQRTTGDNSKTPYLTDMDCSRDSQDSNTPHTHGSNCNHCLLDAYRGPHPLSNVEDALNILLDQRPQGKDGGLTPLIQLETAVVHDTTLNQDPENPGNVHWSN
jgi:hypothetical protein